MKTIPIACVHFNSEDSDPPCPILGWLDRDNPLSSIGQMALEDAQIDYPTATLHIEPDAVNKFTITIPPELGEGETEQWHKVLEVKTMPNFGGDVFIYDDDWSFHIGLPENYRVEVMKKLGLEVPK
jgi:hypothetical protein